MEYYLFMMIIVIENDFVETNRKGLKAKESV